MVLDRARNSVRAFCLDFNLNRHRLTDARNRFGALRKHQIELAPIDWLGGHCPASPCCFVHRRQQLYVQRDRSGNAMHRKIADNIATLWASPLHAAALKRGIGKFFRVKELRAAQMVVAFFDARIDAAHLDLRRDPRILRMFAIDFDLAAEIRELAVSRTEELMHTETNARARGLELIALLCRGGETHTGNENCGGRIPQNPSKRQACHLERSEHI